MYQSFTKAETDYLVAAPKFVWSIPRTQSFNATQETGWLIQTQVFSVTEPNRPIKGLVIKAKLHQAPVGLPHLTPSCALEWYAKRIRGLNYELWHDNPDGSAVKGWHEHVWSPDEQDHRVIVARPEPGRKDLLGVLKWGLRKWNIEVRKEQASLDDIRD